MIPAMPRPDDAFTGLELIILLVVLIGATALLLVHLGGGEMPNWARSFPGGLVAESMYVSGDALQPVGSLIGFSAISGIQGGTMVLYPHPDPDRLGSVQLAVSLFIGDTGAIDMDRLNVEWKSGGSSEPVQKSDTIPLICPNWTIVKKNNILPGHTADADNLLEPGEQFLILACPAKPAAPYQSFTLILHPDGVAMPLPITRTAPMRIMPVNNLG